MNRRIPPLALVGLLLPAAWLLARALPQLALDLPAAMAVGMLFAAAGILVCGAGVASFRLAQTTLDPRQPEKASTLVCRGIYRRTRNPMYLGFVLLLTGWGAMLDNLAALLLVPAGFAAYIDRLQIPAEEQALLQRFGDDYARYMREVRRWL